jgi:uncharacterized membrane protein YfcA
VAALAPLLALALLLGSVVGLSLGLVGAGGSILTVPALIYGLGFDVRDAIPASLILVGVIAGIGALGHARDGTVRLGLAVRFGLAGVLGALLGARLSHLVDPKHLLTLFALVMLAAAVSLARRDARTNAPPPSPHPPHWGRLFGAGFGVGMMTGFFGVGGGFVIVPALALFVGLPTREAVATSLVVIVINCCSALAGHLTAGHAFGGRTLALIGLFGLGGAIGSTSGARLAGRWSPKTLSRIFALIVTVVAVYLLARNALGL